MKLITTILAASGLLVLAACSGADTDTSGAVETDTTETVEADTGAAAGEGPLADVATAIYSIEPTHAFLTATVMHNGLSEYTLSFTSFDGTLDFNAGDPASSSLDFTIDPTSVWVNYPGDYKAGHPDSPHDSWTEALAQDEGFMNAGAYPQITFTSTEVTRTGDTTGTVTGDLTFLGQTQPVTLDVTFNGVANVPWFGTRDIIGFDAVTTINRSEFGQDALQGMISDEVIVEFSGEFLQQEAAETDAETDGN
ncbi:YceI family protein [Henriciella sp.]|uniref:YceI family protein n=1 Tax=Henriciella sp. TaxID=1968823 RepID=UPI00185B1C8E|nr:YceI family protein [Henriciella sp.]HIG23188.1 polyisoprenoid-binding protein [Henriciella sp.]